MPGRTAPCAALLAAAAAGLLGAARPARADSIWCEGGIVSVGDPKIDLVGKCGPPTLREARTEGRGRLLIHGDPRTAEGGRVRVAVETWSYDFGPRRFVQIVTVENGVVARIERGGYGHAADGPPGPGRVPVSTCEAALLDEGDSKLDLLARCGEPAVADAWEEERVHAAVDPGAGVAAESVTVLREVWTYNFGKRRLVRLVHLENGKVVRVETGSYGYGD